MELDSFVEMLDQGELPGPLAEMLAARENLAQADLEKICSIMLEHPLYKVRYLALDIMLCRIALGTSTLTGGVEKAILDVFYLYPETNAPEDTQIIENMKEGVVKFYLSRHPTDSETLSRIFGFVESLPETRQSRLMMEFAGFGDDHSAPETQLYLGKALESKNPDLIKSALRLINVLPGLLKNDWFLPYANFLKSQIPEARYFTSEILKQKSNLPNSTAQELKEYLDSSTVTADIDAAISFMNF